MLKLFLAVMVLAGSLTTRGAVLASSDFETAGDGSDGWTVSGDGTVPAYLSTGGNPGGYITTTDLAQGSVVYWQAPAKFLGDKSAAHGGTLAFDLRQSTTGSQFDITLANPLVRMIGNGVVLSMLGLAPGISFTQYSVELSTSGGWFSGGIPATDTQIQNVLAGLTSISIRAEFAALAGDVDDIDNVYLRSADTAIPEPSTAGLLLLSLAVLSSLRRFRHG